MMTQQFKNNRKHNIEDTFGPLHKQDFQCGNQWYCIFVQ